MHRDSLRAALIAASTTLLCQPLFAQVGNEIVFVGTSTSGSTDRHHFVESATGSIVQSGGVIFTDNVTDAVWADTGRNLYVGQSLQNQVARASWNGASATWSTFYAAPGACYGLGLDTGRQRLWVLTGSGGSARELHAIDADPGSPNYGALITQTNSLSGSSLERWCLSPLGNLACVPDVFINSGMFRLVDLDPSSASYLQVVVSTPVPGAVAAGFSFSSDCKISIDETYAYLVYTGLGPSAVAVYDIAGAAWLDFDAAPGQQDLILPLAVPNKMDLSLDRSFAVISGQGGAGWVMRVDFDYVTPSNTIATQLAAGTSLPDANGISLSPDQSRLAVLSTPTFLSGPSYLTILDAVNGNVLADTTLANTWNTYTTAWQDASPTATYSVFGQGCAGALGVPAIAAAPGSRPALGTTLQVDITNLPFGVAAMASGLSSTITTTGLPLPLNLGVIGMTGCTQYADSLIIDLVIGTGTSAEWSWAVPNNPAFFGFEVFNQAYSFDPAANMFGFTASNAGIATLGF